MALLMEPGQTYNSWSEFKEALDAHSKEKMVIFNVAYAKTVEQSNAFMKKGPFYDPVLKYTHLSLKCKHYGTYSSHGTGLRPKRRSYKINCQAFITISADRKNNFLIIRDSYHKHSHPCTEEIYNSYPEVRRMTKDERRMVGTLMDMGVPLSQIKSAVGKNVTPKDLHNAKCHMRDVKLGKKSEERAVRRAVKREQHLKRVKQEQEEEMASEIDAKKRKIIPSTSVSLLQENVDSGEDIKPLALQNPNAEQSQIDSDLQTSCTQLDESETANAGPEDSVSVSDVTLPMEEKSSDSNTGTDLVSNILNTLQSNNQSIISVSNNSDDGSDKNSYTVVVSGAETEKDSADVAASLQQLFDKIQKEGLNPTDTLPQDPTRFPKTIEQLDLSNKSSAVIEKNCENCNRYMSPLDGHTLCLECLGSEHLREVGLCEVCNAMKPEQLDIRRKKLTSLKFKSLSKKNEAKSQEADYTIDSDGEFQPRKSQRVRKPKDFGPEMAVQNLFHKNVSPNKMTKCVVNDGEREYLVEIPKQEPEDFEYDSSMEIPESPSSQSQSYNSERFEHLLRQTNVFEDVVLKNTDSGLSGFEPGVDSCKLLNKAMSSSDIPSVPNTVAGKYHLESQFEASYCRVPPQVDVPGDTMLNAMGKSLHKLAENANMHTRLAIYDKLFTRLGVGMADEAIGTISQLHEKVTHATEISQEDLTNDLQTVLDTILALKDVLEELGTMSMDALATASHQRSISHHSLEKAKKALKMPLNINHAQVVTKKRKFEPFTKKRLAAAVVLNPDIIDTGSSIPESLPEEVETKIELNDLTSSEETIVVQVSNDMPHSMLAPFMTVSPMTLSEDLLERIQNRTEGVIELNLVETDKVSEESITPVINIETPVVQEDTLEQTAQQVA